MNIFYNYCLTRPDKIDPFHPELDQPFWFGKGKNKRIYVHRREAKRCLKDTTLPRSYKINIIIKLWEQGLDFIEEKICIKLTESEAFEIEKDSIMKYGRKNNGTGILANMTDGGEGMAGWFPSEEARKKMRDNHADVSKENNPNWGIPLSEKQKEILRIANTGREPPNKGIPMSDEQKKKLSESRMGIEPWNKGVPWPEEVKQKFKDNHADVSGKNNPMYGVPSPNKGKELSEEHKRRISESKKKYYQLKREQAALNSEDK